MQDSLTYVWVKRVYADDSHTVSLLDMAAIVSAVKRFMRCIRRNHFVPTMPPLHSYGRALTSISQGQYICTSNALICSPRAHP
jgi:hypothetical protein